MLYRNFLHSAIPGDIELKTILPPSQVRCELLRSSPWPIRGSNCCTPSDGQARGRADTHDRVRPAGSVAWSGGIGWFPTVFGALCVYLGCRR